MSCAEWKYSYCFQSIYPRTNDPSYQHQHFFQLVWHYKSYYQNYPANQLTNQSLSKRQLYPKPPINFGVGEPKIRTVFSSYISIAIRHLHKSDHPELHLPDTSSSHHRKQPQPSHYTAQSPHYFGKYQ